MTVLILHAVVILHAVPYRLNLDILCQQNFKHNSLLVTASEYSVGIMPHFVAEFELNKENW